MGLFDWLFGKPRYGERDTSAAIREIVALKPGRGFTTDVVGEARYQDNLDHICGGKCEEGYRREVTAQLVFISDNPDPNAIGVMIGGLAAGFIPREDAAQLRSEILAINPSWAPVTCKAKIVGGWDDGCGNEGHYGVKLSLSRPVKRA